MEPALWQAIHLLPLLLVNCFRESVCCPKQNIHILTSFVAEQVLMQLKKAEFTRSLMAEGGGDGGCTAAVHTAEPPWMCCCHPVPLVGESLGRSGDGLWPHASSEQHGHSCPKQISNTPTRFKKQNHDLLAGYQGKAFATARHFQCQGYRTLLQDSGN